MKPDYLSTPLRRSPQGTTSLSPHLQCVRPGGTPGETGDDDAIPAVLRGLEDNAGVGEAAAVVVLGQLHTLGIFQPQVVVPGRTQVDGVGLAGLHPVSVNDVVAAPADAVE